MVLFESQIVIQRGRKPPVSGFFDRNTEKYTEMRSCRLVLNKTLWDISLKIKSFYRFPS